ncbi:MAG: ATP-binding protein [bacterium]|nr:ATP-binding protein [bacterium]MDT8396864.1 ATP-binding protein [bacterium]
MKRSLWARFFFLLMVVSAIAFSAALYLREMMVRDFRDYLDGQSLDYVYYTTAELEGSYEAGAGWDGNELAGTAVMALVLGMEVRVHDQDGKLMIDTGSALDSLSPLMMQRVASLVGSRTMEGGEVPFVLFPLFLGGELIGTLEVRSLDHDRSRLFVRRSNRFLMISFLLMGGVAVLASFFVSRRLAGPIEKLVRQTRAIRGGQTGERVQVTGDDEIGRLAAAFNEMVSDLALQESLRKKLIANVAHELRTPLAAMRAELEAMLDDVLPLSREQVSSLHEETGRLAFILDGIDSLTQAQASSLSLNRQMIEIAPLMESIAGRFHARALEEEITLEVESEEGLAAWVDPDRLSQIIINLLGNALRATAGGGKIKVTAFEDGGRIRVEVRDTGSGIPAEALPHIFERFYRGADGGLGLGLPIVKELVDAHGGDVTVESEVGKGTVVTVVLPSGPGDTVTLGK